MLQIEEASFEVDWHSASQQLPSAIGRTTLKLPLDWWRTNKDSATWIEKHLKTIQDMWNETTEELSTYSKNWEKRIPLFHAEGFGEVELALCMFLQRKHAANSFRNTTPIHLQNFVDIGSGLRSEINSKGLHGILHVFSHDEALIVALLSLRPPIQFQSQIVGANLCLNAWDISPNAT